MKKEINELFPYTSLPAEVRTIQRMICDGTVYLKSETVHEVKLTNGFTFVTKEDLRKVKQIYDVRSHKRVCRKQQVENG